MENSDDILSVIFLVLVCMVFAGVVYKLLPDNSLLIIPSFGLIAVAMWMAFDYMTRSRYNAKVKCLTAAHDMKTARLLAAKMDAEIEKDEPPPEVKVPKPKPTLPPPQKQRDDEYDIDMYNESRTIEEMYRDMACPGDTKMCNRMKYMGMQGQLSKNIRAEWNKYSLQPFLEEELAEHSEREWWNSDYLDDKF